MKKEGLIFGAVVGTVLVLAALNMLLIPAKNALGKKFSQTLQTTSTITPEAFPTSKPLSVSPTRIPISTQPKEAGTSGNLADKGPCKRVPVLMYHHVLDAQAAKDIGATNLNVPPDVFRQQVDYLLAKGYTIIGLDELLPKIKDNTLLAKPVVLTFDDGYNNFYTNVYSLLKEKNVKATVLSSASSWTETGI